MSKYRSKVPIKKSKKMFSRSAAKVNPKNVIPPMRGGYRL